GRCRAILAAVRTDPTSTATRATAARWTGGGQLAHNASGLHVRFGVRATRARVRLRRRRQREVDMAMQAEDRMISQEVAPVLVARTLGPFDLVVIFVAIVLFIINSAGLQAAGPSVFVFWIVAFLTFLITGAFVTAQLGRMFPE